MDATSAHPILLLGSGVQAVVGLRLVLVDNRILPQYFRLVVVDLHLVDHRVLPVDFRLALLDLHLDSPWLWVNSAKDKPFDCQFSVGTISFQGRVLLLLAFCKDNAFLQRILSHMAMVCMSTNCPNMTLIKI